MSSPQKLLLLFLTIFAIQSVMLLFLVLRPMRASAQARAGGETGEGQGDCPCRVDDGGHKIDTTRLYIPIPGVTDACGFVCDINEDGRGDIVDYIFTVYKLLIGVAAVVAFAMIVYAGYEWIFAMGNSGKIEDAKERIMSAFIGLGLALASFQFLQTLSPQLTNLYLPDVTKIARASVNPFCRDTDIVYGTNIADPKNPVAVALPSARTEDKTQLTCQSQFTVADRIEGDKAYCYSTNKAKCWKEITAKFGGSPSITGEDGKSVAITYENIVTYDAKSAPKCQGAYCGGDPENVCYPADPYARSFECKSADNACNDTDDKRNGCEEVNKWLAFQGYTSKKCAKREDTGWALTDAGDECVLGAQLKCPAEYLEQAKGDQLFHTDAVNVCWEARGQAESVLKDCTAYDGKKIYPVLDGVAVKGANALCCRRESTTEKKDYDYRCETENTGTVLVLLNDIREFGTGFSIKFSDDPDAEFLHTQASEGGIFGSTCNKGTEPIPSASDCVIKDTRGTNQVAGQCQVEEGYFTISSRSGTNKVSRGVCFPSSNDSMYGALKICHGSETTFRWYVDFDTCKNAENNVLYNCNTYLLSSTISCIGETTGTEVPQLGANPLLKTTQQNSQLTPAFKTASDALKEKDKSGTFTNEADAESFLESLAMVESAGGTKVSQREENPFINIAFAQEKACGIMQIIPSVAQKYNQNATCEWMNKVENFDESVDIAASYIVDLLNDGSGSQFKNICPDSSPRYGSCDYVTDDGNDNYSSCRDAMRGNDIYKKLPYLYGAYNGGSDANCHNDTNFYGEPDGCNKPPNVNTGLLTICPLYQQKKGSVWECDRGEGYEQTRKGASRLIDCMKQFKDYGSVGSQTPSAFQSGSCCGSADCLTGQCSIQ